MTDALGFRRLCATVGYIVIHWGQIEQYIDTWVSIAFNQPGGTAIPHHPTIPRAIKRKFDFLNKSCLHVPTLSPFATELKRLLESLYLAAQVRNWLVHGAIIGELNETSVEFRKLIHYDDEITHTVFAIALTDFPRLEKRYSALLDEAEAMTVKLGTAFPASIQ